MLRINMKTITYKQYNEQINKYNNLIQQGFRPIIKRDWFKIVAGFVCLGIAIFPNGLGIVFYPLGFFLLGVSIKDIIEYKRKIKNKIRGYRVLNSVTL